MADCWKILLLLEQLSCQPEERDCPYLDQKRIVTATTALEMIWYAEILLLLAVLDTLSLCCQYSYCEYSYIKN